MSNKLIAAELRVAVASNFAKTAQELTRDFENKYSHTISLSRGSSGKHYAQIKNGAPFDVFLAANTDWPKRLEKEGFAVVGSRFTYAIGKIVLWSSSETYIGSGDQVLQKGDYRYLAIANPRLAPYGLAAKEILQNLDLWTSVEDKLVMGENINQAFLFVKSANAELGFTALSQLMRLGDEKPAYVWQVPASLYAPLAQQAIVIKQSQAASEYMRYLASEAAQSIIKDNGYGLPHAQ